MKLLPIVHDKLCRVYITQTLTRWHDGVARPEWANYWVERYGALTDDEAAATKVLREQLLEKGCAFIKEAMRENPTLNDASVKAFAALSHRVERIYQDAKPALLQWAERIAHQPPEWFSRMSYGLDTFFHIRGDYELHIYLLPSPPRSNCGNGDMFVEEGAITLACSGMPLEDDGVFLVLLHEGAHSIHQKQILNPLVADLLDTPYGQRISEMYWNSPVGELIGDLPSYIGELVIHSLVPYGALREFYGLGSSESYWNSIIKRAQELLHRATTDWGDVYTAWVSAACAKMVPLGREYIVRQKPLDETFVYGALETFEGIYLRWQQESGKTNPSSRNQ